MVLGLRSKTRKLTPVQLSYLVHIHEIKPWPPSQSLKSLRSVVLQWDAGGDRDRDRSSSGTTDPVTPSPDEGRIEFNKSFNLHVTLLKDASSGPDKGFLKNVLELNLYEPRGTTTSSSRAVKGQLIGNTAFDLAELGVVKEDVDVAVPVSCKRSFRNTAQPVLYLTLHPVDKDGGSVSSSVSKGSASGSGRLSSKTPSLDRDDKESVSTLMTEEYAEEAEVASFTDDDLDGDGQPRSSLGNSPSSSSASPNTDASPSNGAATDDHRHVKNASETAEVIKVEDAGNTDPPTSINNVADSKDATESHDAEDIKSRSNEDSNAVLPDKSPTSESLTIVSPSQSASVISNNHESSEKEVTSSSDSPVSNLTRISQVLSYGDIHLPNPATKCSKTEGIILNAPTTVEEHLVQVEESFVDCNSHAIEGFDHPVDIQSMCHEDTSDSTHLMNNQENGLSESEKVIQIEVEEESIKEIQDHSVETKLQRESNPADVSSLSVPNADQLPTLGRQNFHGRLISDSPTFSRRTLGGRSGISSNGSSNGLENMKFPVVQNQFKEDVEVDILEDGPSSSSVEQLMKGAATSEQYVSAALSMKPDPQVDTTLYDKKIQELESRVEMLEAELRDIAAIEVGLYSVVAEHGGSAQKVHAPARRLSRLYTYALENWSISRNSSTARSIVSGLVLAAKACGNDVPRLTFWLSNLAVLRSVATQDIEHLSFKNSGKGSENGSLPSKQSANDNLTMADLKPFSLRWKPSKEEKNPVIVESDNCNWQEPQTFLDSLEKVESWIFSRIIKSLWWQTMTPFMQTSNAENEQKSFHKSSGKLTRLSNFQRTDSSTDHWKKAFKEACERLCPVRAAGLECGCLSSVAQLVMEQCVTRLDVAIFNAIMRVSDDEISTDPVSDPITDSNVIPISAGKLSFGDGAQLKNVIGNWSRWLTDLFGIDDDQRGDMDGEDFGVSHKSFCMLNALSDLLMLPKDLLLEPSIRKEVFPVFSGLIIKRILSYFVTDEFCPDPVPDNVFQALDDEDNGNGSSELLQDLPCSAPPIVYTPPSAASVARQIGLTTSTVGSRPIQRSESYVLRKCYTSDDELDELESPLDSVVLDKSSLPQRPKLEEKKGRSAMRYQLLREVWMGN